MNKKKKEQDNKARSEAFEQALRALDTLEEIDLTLVPTRPTPEMSLKVSKITCLPINVVNEVYELMIKASQEL